MYKMCDAHADDIDGSVVSHPITYRKQYNKEKRIITVHSEAMSLCTVAKSGEFKHSM